MVNGAVLPAVSTSPFYLGSYPSFQGVYLNPLTSTGLSGFPEQSSTFRQFNDPRLSIPGQIGNYTYYPTYEGPYSNKQKSTINSEIVQIDYNYLTTIYNDYKAKNQTYHSLRHNFIFYATREQQRLSDSFLFLFEKADVIPTRPCAPK